jgi:hypothetical protein
MATGSGPAVQIIRIHNSAWMNCKLQVLYGYDEQTHEFKKASLFTPEIMKDQNTAIDLSTIADLKEDDLVLPRVDAPQPQTGSPVAYSKNKQTAVFEFKGTLFGSWLERT